MHGKLSCMVSYRAWLAIVHGKLSYMVSYRAWWATVHGKRLLHPWQVSMILMTVSCSRRCPQAKAKHSGILAPVPVPLTRAQWYALACHAMNFFSYLHLHCFLVFKKKCLFVENLFIENWYSGVLNAHWELLVFLYFDDTLDYAGNAMRIINL